MKSEKIEINKEGETTFVLIKLNQLDVKYFYQKITEMDWYGESFTWGYDYESEAGKIVLAFEKVKLGVKKRNKIDWVSIGIIFLSIMGMLYIFMMFLGWIFH
ncbi:hypothetical protein ACFQ49_13955 [Kroppenstedtia eburnea]|uniref:DUF2812 domain-containing protein n=1 Tax=Kroppenstedtia guangzhouensis TaxID=1274356 RepID=A0ABQ1H5P2_9BACL|nr:hypothetical protein [Kroppenstedtia guangzhouensis]GGA58439.1 hypothetical protein GCM10007416_34580 [Kroppenstedtia guangzhouensis]